MRHRLIIPSVLITLLFGSVYGLLHGMNRSMANDMPELLASQVAKQLEVGLGLESVQMGRTDLANNPVPFVIVYDKKSKPLAGSGYLRGTLAQIPVGVVNHATTGKPHAVTWQPQKGVRIASVTVKAGDYYVVGGQSLKMTENRSTRLLWYTLAGYLITLVSLVAATWATRRWCAHTHDRCTCSSVPMPDSLVAAESSQVKRTPVKKTTSGKKRINKTAAK